MEKLSRTKKYQDLREQLQNDGESAVQSNDLNEYANRLNRINSEEFVGVEEPKYANTDPLREKKVENPSYFEGVNFPASPQETTYQEKSEPVNSTFNNEYMDDYLNEVKEYNKDRGYAKETDTTLNILEELKSRNESRPANDGFDIDSIIAANKFVDDDLNLPFSFGLDTDEKVSQLTDEVRNLVNEPVVENNYNQTSSYFEEQKVDAFTSRVADHSGYSEPVDQETKIFTAPLTGGYEEPVAKPVHEEPVLRPTYEEPVRRQVYQEPVNRPVYQEPVAKPVYEEPAAKPMYEAPVTRQDYEEPVARAAYEDLIAKPIYEEPVVRQVQEQPAARPYAEPVNTYGTINNDFADVQSQKSAMAQAVETELRKEEEIKIKTDVVVEAPKARPVAEPIDDDYEDEKGGTANKILNVILFILIIALLIVLGVVVYWTLLNRGVI